MKRTTMILGALTAMAVIATVPAAELLNISHDGTSGDEDNPFGTLVLSNSIDWTYTTDGARSVMTALDNNNSTTTNGGDNRLILVQSSALTEFGTTSGEAAAKGWIFKVELEILQGNGSGDIAFAQFGVRGENNVGKGAWIGLSNNGGAGDTGRIGFMTDPTTGSQNFSGATADLDVDSLIGDGQYHNFKIHKYDAAGTTTVDVFMDGTLMLSRAYSALPDDRDGQSHVQAFASATPVPLSEVNIDFVNFTLYDTLTESIPDDGTDPMLASTNPVDNATNVQPTANLVASFDEAIVLGTAGDVTIRNLTDPADTIISLGGSDPDGTLTASGNQLTIDPAVDLAVGDTYAVLIQNTVVEDLLGNTYAGITDNTTWSFMTTTPSTTVAYWNARGTDTSTVPDLAGGDHSLSGASNIGASGITVAPNPVPNPDAVTTGAAGSIFFSTGATSRAPVTSNASAFKLTSSSSFTFEGWLLHDVSDGTHSGTEYIGGDRHADTGYNGWHLVVASGKVQIFAQGTTITSTTRIDDGDAHHFAAVWDHDSNGGEFRLYVDGAPEGTAGATLVSYTQSVFAIGGRSTSGSTYDDSILQGRLDEMRFSSAVLTPSEFLSATTSPTNTFANWIDGFGLDAGDKDFTDDPDGDGLENGLEAFFGTNPSVSTTGLAEVSKAGNTVSFRHPNPDTPLSDVTGSYQWSLDLNTWYADDGIEGDGSTTLTTVATADDPEANTTTVDATIGGTVPAKIFLRVVATQ